MIEITDKLTRAVQIWTGVPESADNSGDNEKSFRGQIDDYWLGTECQFLTLMRSVLQDSDSMTKEIVSEQLDLLCDEFSHDLQTISQLVDSDDYLPQGAFLRDRHKKHVEDQAGKYWNSLPTAVRHRREAIREKLWPSQPTEAKNGMPRMALLAASMAFLSRAALKLSTWDSLDEDPQPGFVDDVCTCMICLHAVWPLLTAQALSVRMHEYMNRLQRQYRAINAMCTMAGFEEKQKQPCTAAAWLSVLNGLRWLLREEPPSPPQSTEGRLPVNITATVKLPMVSGGLGELQELKLQGHAEAQSGCCIDLVKTGMVLLDSDMLESLNIAWEVSEAELSNLSVRENHTLAIQLALPTDINTRMFRGDSAGGLAAISMYALSEGNQPDSRVTGSFTIRRGGGIRVNSLSEISIEGVKSLEDKLDAAAEPQTNCTHFLVSAASDQHTEKLKDIAVTKRIRLVPLLKNEFHKAVRQLSTEAKLSRMLEPLNARIIEAWNSLEGDDLLGLAAGTGKAVYLRKPQPYIEPHLGELRPKLGLTDSQEDVAESRKRQVGIDRESRYLWLTDNQEIRDTITNENQSMVAEDEFVQMFHLAEHSHRICIAEDANAGKSVLSKRLTVFLAGPLARRDVFGGQPPLVIRWENGPLGQSEKWPDVADAKELCRRLADGLRTSAYNDLTSADVDVAIKDLVRQGRVVLLLDSLDQATESSCKMLEILESNADFSGVWVVVTGRSFSFTARNISSLFDRRRWVMMTILRFTQNQQTRFLRASAMRWNGHIRAQEEEFGPLLRNQSVADMFVDYGPIEELLGVAGMLAMVREIAVLEQQSKKGISQHSNNADRIPVRLARLRTRCDFYLEFFNRQMLKAAEKDTQLNVDAHRERWQMMLSVTAFRMVLERATNYAVQDDVRNEVIKDVQTYCQILDSSLIITDNDWAQLNQFSAFSDHSFLEGLHGRNLSFRHKGWMEFFAGLFLAKFADARALPGFDFDSIRPVLDEDEEWTPGFQGIEFANYDDSQESIDRLFDDVLLQLTNDPQWYWMWRFAIEMPRYVPNGSQRPKGPVKPLRLGRSLGLLLRQPVREIRPNELAWRAFYLFEYDERTDAELRVFRNLIPQSERDRVLTAFRKSNASVVAQIKACTDRGDHVPLKDTAAYADWLAWWQRASSEQKSHTFLQCPPASWLAADNNANVNVMGSNGSYGDTSPQHRVRVQAYRMQSTTVTRGMYRLFDSALETTAALEWNGESVSQGIRELASGFDQNHSDGDFPIICVSWHDAFMFSKWLGPEFRIPTEIEWEFACRAGTTSIYHFGDTLNGTAANCNGNFPNGWDKPGTLIPKGRSVGRTTPVGSQDYPCNSFGLFDMHGNVTEWCAEWRTEGFTRILRGGAWLSQAVACASGYRSGLNPDARNKAVGFRLCMDPDVPEPTESTNTSEALLSGQESP